MFPPLKSIVVGVAQPGVPDPALNVALQIAAQCGATLHVVHACPAPTAGSASGRSRFNQEWIHGEGHRLQELVRTHVARISDYHNQTVSAVPGPADQVIHEMAIGRGADLIVVGATRHGAATRVLLGTTAHRVLSGASAPVLLARRSAHPMTRALLTTDLSSLSSRAYERSADLLPRMLGTMPLLRSLLVTGSDPQLGAMVPGIVSAAQAEHEQFLRELALDGASSAVRIGLAGPEILAESEQWEADLVVMGSHSRRGIARVFMGSVAEWVLQRSSCNVLVFPASAATMRFRAVAATGRAAV
jgi:nucleotide-binding universal stress UspA family protein